MSRTTECKLQALEAVFACSMNVGVHVTDSIDSIRYSVPSLRGARVTKYFPVELMMGPLGPSGAAAA
eukprot:10866926-Alexandrium_andersonii.AAC.1